MLANLDGHLCLCREWGGNLCVVNRPEAKAWETFELHRLDEVRITLKANNGQFLSTEQDGKSLVVAFSLEARERETFQIYIDESGLVAIAAYNGKYLSAESEGILTANIAMSLNRGRGFVL
ncbi:fascin domain-containing protein [Paenibacillus sp. 1A_MP2]|uniref:fascin domain-containing protein n=1 Tax=Paenibacillus sp. 1A_MP2 TaxID=3457495 RepID=UPI003FCDB743